MIEGLFLALFVQALIILVDPEFWLILTSLLEREDRKNSDLRTWELTGL